MFRSQKKLPFDISSQVISVVLKTEHPEDVNNHSFSSLFVKRKNSDIVITTMSALSSAVSVCKNVNNKEHWLQLAMLL